MWICLLPFHNMNALLCFALSLCSLLYLRNQSLVYPFHCLPSVTFTKTTYSVQFPSKHLRKTPHVAPCSLWILYMIVSFVTWVYVCDFSEGTVDRDGHVEVKLWILLVVSFLVVTSLFQVWSCWVLFRVVGLLTASDAFPELLVLLKQTALTLFTIDVCYLILIL